MSVSYRYISSEFCIEKVNFGGGIPPLLETLKAGFKINTIKAEIDPLGFGDIFIFTICLFMFLV